MKTKKQISQQTYEDLIILLIESGKYVNSNYLVKYIPEIKNTSALREIINYLRSVGSPIVSNSNGYKWSNDKEEILSTVHSLHSRINKINEAANGMLKALIN